MPDTLSLLNKVAIVTGSGRENGIGAGIGLALARNGASVVVHYVSDSVKDRAAEVCETLRKSGGQAIAVQAALDTIDGAKRLVNETLEGFNTDHIDILVNNAGVAYFCPITQELNLEQLSGVFQVNVLGPFYMVHTVLPHMPRGGRIINISSTNSKRGNVNISTYAASKAALDSLTWTWAGELGQSRGITVNSIAPGPVLTDLYPKGHEQALMETEIALTRAENRAGTTADIGDAVLLIVNEKSRWITGQYISDGGSSVAEFMMASPAWDIEPLEVFDARQALRIGAYNEAQATLDRLPKASTTRPDAILLRLEIFRAQGDYLTSKKFVSHLLDEEAELQPPMLDLLRLVQARCRMMTDMAMSDYLAVGLAVWDRSLKSANLKACDQTTLFLEAEFQRGMHEYIHFVYNSKNAVNRPRDTSFGIESMDGYPLPLPRKEAAVRLTTVVRRLLQHFNPHAALSVFNAVTGWYVPDEVDAQELLQEILDHGVHDILLATRVYIQSATVIASHETFDMTNTIIDEAKNAVAFLGPSEYTNELRLLDAKMAFIGFGSINALSVAMLSDIIEGEYVSMVRDFMLAAQYNLAAKAVTEYMDCIDYIRPTRVNEILELSDLLGATSGNNVYMWTTRLIALGSAPLHAQIALGRQSVWCQTYLEKYAYTGAWEMSKRFALYYSIYYQRIGDWTQQLSWCMAAGEFDGLITNDPYTTLSVKYRTFIVMIHRLQNLPGGCEQHEREEVQQFGIDGFEACEEAGFKDLAHSFADKLECVGLIPKALMGAMQENMSLTVAPLGEPKNLDSLELLALYIKQRDLLDRLLDHDCADQAFELHDQLNAYMEPIFKVLRHGMDLKLRSGDYALIQNAMGVRLAKGVLRVDKATPDQWDKALAIAKTVAARCGEIGQLETQREAFLVAAQWVFKMKKPNWGKVVVDLLHQADDCMDMSRKHVTATSRLDSLDQKQHLVASYGRSDVYVFGYMVMTALQNTSDSLAVMKPEDKFSATDVWTWMQRGKGRSVIDLIHAGESAVPPQAPSTADTVSKDAADKASLAANLDVGITLQDVQSMASDYSMSSTGSAMIMVDWVLTSSHIDMVIVDAAGEVHVEILDFTLIHAMKKLLDKPVTLRGAEDVKAWKETYLGQSEFLADVLTPEALAELDWLVEPLEQHSKPGDLLVLCPSGVLHGLPLHALSVAGQLLIERNPVVYTSSLSLLFSCYKNASKRDTAASSSAVFGVFGKAGRDGATKSAEEQKVEATLESVASLLDTNVQYGISPDQFVAKCKDQHIIHYHGHAILGKTKQSRFGQSLVLANSSHESDLLHWDDAIDNALLLGGHDDNADELGPASPPAARLSARDMITQLTLSAAHVTLIACNSASQEVSAGDEPQGIIPVLLLCGATSVLGTLWPILSVDGRAFSDSFYAASLGRRQAAGAVVNLARAVQRSVLEMRAKRPAPIHWAGFVLHGAWFHKC